MRTLTFLAVLLIASPLVAQTGGGMGMNAPPPNLFDDSPVVEVTTFNEGYSLKVKVTFTGQAGATYLFDFYATNDEDPYLVAWYEGDKWVDDQTVSADANGKCVVTFTATTPIGIPNAEHGWAWMVFARNTSGTTLDTIYGYASK